MTDEIETNATQRDDLLDRLAKVKFDQDSGSFGPAWDQIDDEEWEEYARDVEPFMPVIAEFVAEWLTTEPEDGHRPALPNLAADWRADMNEENSWHS